MQKYTVIYNAYVGNGHYVVSYRRVETDNVKKLFDDPSLDDIVFIFYGWPTLEGEEVPAQIIDNLPQ